MGSKLTQRVAECRQCRLIDETSIAYPAEAGRRQQGTTPYHPDARGGDEPVKYPLKCGQEPLLDDRPWVVAHKRQQEENADRLDQHYDRPRYLLPLQPHADRQQFLILRQGRFNDPFLEEQNEEEGQRRREHDAPKRSEDHLPGKELLNEASLFA